MAPSWMLIWGIFLHGICSCLGQKDAKGDGCTAVVKNCNTCKPGTTKCTACANGYSLPNSGCTTACAKPKCISCSKSPAQCTECVKGYGTRNYECTKCPENCQYCKDGECRLCNVGFGLDSGKCQNCNTLSNCIECNNVAHCTRCAPKFFLGQGICQGCSANCNECAELPYCQVCVHGYGTKSEFIETMLNGRRKKLINGNSCQVCQGIDKNCQNCNNNPTVCSRCKAGYFLKADVCQLCDVNCKQGYCMFAGCTECKDGYFPHESKCKKCKIANCQRCYQLSDSEDAAKCMKCKDTYHLHSMGTGCKRCVDGCKSCSMANSCDECKVAGQVYNEGTLKCETCNTKVQDCTKCNKGKDVCLGCRQGYFINATSSSCQRCPYACSECKIQNQAVRCSRCKQPYSKVGPSAQNLPNCDLCKENCLECHEDTKACFRCSTGYSVSRDKCLGCGGTAYSKPCLNGKCTGKYCSCKEGYIGRYCEQPIVIGSMKVVHKKPIVVQNIKNMCDVKDPCKHGTCQQDDTSYTCICHVGWTNTDCTDKTSGKEDVTCSVFLLLLSRLAGFLFLTRLGHIPSN